MAPKTDVIEQLRVQLAAAQEEIAKWKALAEANQTLAEVSQRRADRSQAQLAKAEQLWQVAQGRCDGLEEKLAKAEQRVAEACANYVNRFINGDGILNEVWISDIESALRNGEWRKHMKGD